MTTTTESLFSCYTCGFAESFAHTFDNNNNSPTMQRASVSRQTDHRHSASNFVRSRSEERDSGSNHNNKNEMALQINDTMDDEDASSILESALLQQKQQQIKKEEDDDEFHDAVQDHENHPNGTATTTNPKTRIHRRAMSDPFDTPLSDREMDEIRLLEEAALEQEEVAKPVVTGLPTLPRYPVAATRDKNCWSEPPISIYSVRGPTYLHDKKKVPSKEYLLRTRGCDLFLFDGDIDMNSMSSQVLNGQLRSLPTLSINFRFPWGCMILYFEIPDKLSKYVGETSGLLPLHPDFSPSERVMANWLQGDAEYKNERLKLIPYVSEGPWVVRNMVTGRPAIIGKKLPVSYQSAPASPALAPLLQCTLDIGSSSATAKRIVSVCRRYMSALTVDIGFVIQGETADELPEQMLGAARVHGADPLKAPKL